MTSHPGRPALAGVLRLPSGDDWAALCFGGAAWTGVVAGASVVGPSAPAFAAAMAIIVSVATWGLRAGSHRLVQSVGAVGMALGLVSGAASSAADAAIARAPVPAGPIDAVARLHTDPESGRFDSWVLASVIDLETNSELGPTALVTGPISSDLAVGDHVHIRGVATDRDGRAGGVAYGWRIAARAARRVDSPSGLLAVSNELRERVSSALEGYGDRPAAGLVAGFLIGDERGIPEVDREAMRSAGLSHFTAVSGSNVALFLGGLWFALGPLGMGRWRRAAIGGLGLVVFAGMTRWEPSVLRACAMAAGILGGRAIGLAVTPWMALGGAVGVLVVADGHLVSQPGFHLSVVAAAGVIAAAGAWRRRIIGPALSATIGAHVAVAPVLLLHFGRIPEWGPALNLAAAPVVAFSTAAGGVGALVGAAPLTRVAVEAADLVLRIARAGSSLPPLGWLGPVLLVAGVGAVRYRALRLPAFALGIATALTSVSPTTSLPPGAVVFLDVGQGDAAIVRSPEGHTVVVDGGPDPIVLDQALRRWSVDRVDLLIISHSHRDHVEGLDAVFGRRTVGTVWHSDAPDPSGYLGEALVAAEEAGASVIVPQWGSSAHLGGLRLDVLAPLRRYASPNDQSLVVVARLPGGDVAFTGDIESYAQADLEPVDADILKVPHQGAATSDLEWLAAVAPRAAVISVGPNSYGHPDPSVVAELEGSGAHVYRTDRDGDVFFDLGG